MCCSPATEPIPNPRLKTAIAVAWVAFPPESPIMLFKATALPKNAAGIILDRSAATKLLDMP